MTVRHPFERILSAYRDKFYVLADTPNEKNKAAKFFRLYGNKIIHKYRSKEDTTAQSPKYEQLSQLSHFVVIDPFARSKFYFYVNSNFEL